MTSAPRLFDSQGNEIHLGDIIGKGGEGSVYNIDGDENLVAKLYHQRPLPAEMLAKLHAMIGLRTPELDSISAWPRSLVHDPRSRDVLGIIMPRVHDALQLHELYGTANRRRSFPEARWHHLLLAARNIAAAFETMHSAGIIVGDVNQGNMLVDNNMCVRFIDCDSFQFESGGRVFACPVGTPHFTPPELQSQKLRNVQRTNDHDAFGLATVIFHLLFVGRHPFAGRYLGEGELSIETAIAERRFAFSRHSVDTQVEPPPASLLLNDLPAPIAQMFELAFRSNGDQATRPSPKEWVTQLETLIRQRSICSYDRLHVYYNQLANCPWCRIEDAGGPAFFFAESGLSMVSVGRLEALDRKIQQLQIPEFVDLSPGQLKLPSVLKPKKLAKSPPATICDVAASAMVAAASLCLLGIKWLPAIGIGAITSIGAGAYLIFSKQGRDQRERGAILLEKLEQNQAQLAKGARLIMAKHQSRKRQFASSVEDLKKAYELYQAEESQLQDVLAIQRAAQLNRYLASQLIQDNITRIPGLTSSILSMLESYGVESALDVDNLKLMGVPMLSPELALELLSWRESVTASFKFKPEHGVSMEDAKLAGEAALRRFKIAQARKVLMGGTQLEALSEVGKAEVARDLKRFSDVADKGRQVANQLREFQSGRRFLERELNRHPAVTAAAAVGIPVVGYILRMIFG